jgi:hypothetical protein
MGLAFWENGYTTLPFFNLAPIFGRVKTSILHGAWRFQIFPNFLAKIRLHQDLHINCWDFCLMKK